MSACIWYISKYATLPSDRVGARSFLLMREIARVGHRPVIFTSDANHLVSRPAVPGTHLRQTIDGVEICWVRTRKYHGARSLGRILSWLDFEWRLWRLPKRDFPQPDVVVASSLSLFSIFTGLLLRRRYKCRLVFEVRDIWPLTIIEEGGFSSRNPLVLGLSLVERLAYRHSDAIVGTMPNLEEHVREVAGHRAAPVHCIPMGFDSEQIDVVEPLPAAFAEEHIPRGKFLVCHAGTIGTTNALETLFACAQAMRDRPDIHFLIVGDGDLKPKYQARWSSLPNLSFVPRVPKAMVQAMLQRCDLLYLSVHVSKVWRYGQSLNKVIDYMLASRPIIASYSGYPSMIDESGGGTFVPAGDVGALKAAILDYADMTSEQRAEIGSAARKWLLQHRGYPQLARQYLALAIPEQTLA